MQTHHPRLVSGSIEHRVSVIVAVTAVEWSATVGCCSVYQQSPGPTAAGLLAVAVAGDLNRVDPNLVAATAVGLSAAIGYSVLSASVTIAPSAVVLPRWSVV